MRVAALFAGIGGIELGLERAGHETVMWCENDPSAASVMKARFQGAREWHNDVVTLGALPDDVELVTAGFPCQDLSQAGQTQGMAGTRSSLVSNVFRLLDERPVPWILIENVPFMLQLSGGEAMQYVVSQLENRGYRWAYRIVDSRAFGLPQRRRRVYLLASRDASPEAVLFGQDADEPKQGDVRGRACGFYWTEGTRGLGWAVDAVPTIKGGSALGIPSPPAIWMPDGRIVKPDIRDAERLQGFPADWTKPAEEAGRASYRWKLVGNAVTVRAAEWIGHNLLAPPGSAISIDSQSLRRERSWPSAAFGSREGRQVVRCSERPVQVLLPPLADFLDYCPTPLSERATAGFVGRLQASSLNYPAEFMDALRAHLLAMGRNTELALH